MKKISCYFEVLLLLLALTACSGQQAVETSCTPAEIAEEIIESQSELPALNPLTAEDEYFATYLSDFYLLDSEQVEDGAIYYADGVEASEIAVLVMKDQSNAETTRTQLLEYLTSRAGVFEGYAPQQAALVKDGVVTTNGKYVALLICADTESAQLAFANCFGENAPSESTVKPVSQAEMPVPEQTTPASDVSNEPPESDSTDDAYDADAVLLAYETGDASALSDMNRSILDAAKDVIEKEISDNMSDYEKELAIHDWMTGWSSFDMNVFSHAPAARAEADNRNPYGFFINKSAMCHGYSSTFQLFMDMLDIECITVFGIPGGNGVEHSWNMVRLDGDWYCVDTAWDDPIGGSPCHTYFNVTSDYLRSGSIHRWDDTSVPEADGTAWAYGKH